MARGASVSGVVTRIVSVVALVRLTFNPAGHSYTHWALRDLSQFSALQAVPGALLLCGWVLFVRAALASLGWVGVALASLVIAALVWLLVDAGILDAAGGRPRPRGGGGAPPGGGRARASTARPAAVAAAEATITPTLDAAASAES